MQTIVAAPELELSNQTGVSLHRIAILTSPSIQQEDVSSKPFFLTKMAYKKTLLADFFGNIATVNIWPSAYFR